MISNIFHILFFDPIYNLLVVLSGILPGGSLGFAIITLTLLIKFILLPLQHKTLKIQNQIKALDPKLQEIKKKYENNRQEQAKRTMEIYREYGINPLTTFWTVLLQFPVIIALYLVFRESATIHTEFLYSFITAPQNISVVWLGLIDLTKPFLSLSIFVGLSQFFQLTLAIPPVKKSPASEPGQELAKNFQRQMRFWLPPMIILIASSLPSAVSLYWLTSNLFAIGHELAVRRKAEGASLVEPKEKLPQPH